MREMTQNKRNKTWNGLFLIIFSFGVLIAGLAGVASAQSCPVGTVNGSFTGSETIENDRINRNGVASTCAGKAFPGTVASQSRFQTFTYQASLKTACVTVNFNIGTMGSNVFMAAYANSYDPNNMSQNYLGDLGSSVTQSFSFNIAAYSNLVLLVETIGTSVTGSFSFSVQNFPCETSLVIGNTILTNGDLIANKVSYTRPREHVTSVSSEAFVPRTDFPYTNGGSMGGAYIMASNRECMDAAVQLPDGATVTKFRAYVYDNSSNDLFVDLSYQNLLDGGYSASMALVTTSGAQDAYTHLETTSINDPVIDNTRGGYFVLACPVVGNTWDGVNLRVRGASIYYTLAEAP